MQSIYYVYPKVVNNFLADRSTCCNYYSFRLREKDRYKSPIHWPQHKSPEENCGRDEPGDLAVQPVGLYLPKHDIGNIEPKRERTAGVT